MYKVILSLHIISVISWMAGLLYLFRLFVYHAAEKEAVVKTRFKTMEDKLYNIITIPAMMASFLFGFVMIMQDPALALQPWLHLKLLLVLLMFLVTLYGGNLKSQLQQGKCPHSHKYFRVMNEVPTLLMIAIVFLVILKPFSA